MNYQKNRLRARIVTTQPSLTDQAAAKESDMNIIVNKLLRTGQINDVHEPIYGDFTNIPYGLREMIEHTRQLDELRSRLPDKLQSIPLDQLATLTNQQLSAILTPPQPTEPQEPQK